ncbi:hypothetical protein Hanom_Chr05g00398591 [Helianthus anomalus]
MSVWECVEIILLSSYALSLWFITFKHFFMLLDPFFVLILVIYEILVVYVVAICLVLIFVRFRRLGFESHDSFELLCLLNLV